MKLVDIQKGINRDILLAADVSLYLVKEKASIVTVILKKKELKPKEHLVM